MRIYDKIFKWLGNNFDPHDPRGQKGCYSEEEMIDFLKNLKESDYKAFDKIMFFGCLNWDHFDRSYLKSSDPNKK